MEVLLNKLFDKHSEGYGVYDRENLIKDICKEVQNLQLQQGGVVRSCSHENYTNYCNTDGSFSHKLCDDCFEMFD